jgi:cell division septation protein DedD
MYSFLFDKKSLVLLLAGAAVAGGALFFSGLLVGVQWGLPLEAPPAVAPRPPAPKRAALPAADRPCRPQPEAMTATAAPRPAPPPKPELHAAAPPPVLPAPVPPPPAPLASQPKAVPAVARTAEPAADAESRYSLQIGAFREARNSEKVIQALQSRGYEPYVVAQKGRSPLQTVRIGRYADRAEALRAASDFRRREGMEAIVRPIGS